MKTCEQNLYDSIKRSNLCVIDIEEWDNLYPKEIRNIFNETVEENFPNIEE
jgi:hypothetical protein